MRLLDATTGCFREIMKARTEPYAVLSHTWGDDEISFQDMSLPNVASKNGYSKITETCRLALNEGVEVRLDRDMLYRQEEQRRAYRNHQLYVRSVQTDLGTGLKYCRWITRGWTLQELLAAKNVRFYDQTWTYKGSKKRWAQLISAATGIHPKALDGSPLKDFSVAERMYWASKRETTRVEDLAYCLLGIFGVHMPLIYGEGMNAFRRLQEEIVKRNNDLTIFAWNQPEDHPHHDSLFSRSPSSFRSSLGIQRLYEFEPEFSLTNNGLKFKYRVYGLPSPHTSRNNTIPNYDYFLWLGRAESPDSTPEILRVGLYLNKVGPDTFVRRPGSNFISRPDSTFCSPNRYYVSSSSRPKFSVIVDPDQTRPDPRRGAIQFLIRADGVEVSPLLDKFWDNKENLFFEPPSTSYVCAVSLGLKINHKWYTFAVLYNSTTGVRIFDKYFFPTLCNWLCYRLNSKDCPRWEEIKSVEPKVKDLTNELKLAISGDRYVIRTTLIRHTLSGNSLDIMYKAKLSVRKLYPDGRVEDLNYSD